MLGAKVIANLKPSSFEILRAADNKVSLRFSFKIPDKANPIAFFVPARAAGFTPYSKKNPDMHFISLIYSMKSPDDLIELLGQILEANVNARRRKKERIVITPESLRGIGLDAKEAHVYIDSIPRKCIVRDLSFSGAKILIVGVAKFLVDKDAVLQLSFGSGKELFKISGKIIRFEEVAGRKDISSLAINFEEEEAPVAHRRLHPQPKF